MSFFRHSVYSRNFGFLIRENIIGCWGPEGQDASPCQILSKSVNLHCGDIAIFSFFLAWDVIYTSRVYATMSVSICLHVCLWHLCILVTGCNGSGISLHAWIDRCLCYLLTTPHPDHRMGWCRDFWWKRGGGMEKLAIVVILLILLTENLWQLCLSTMLIFL